MAPRPAQTTEHSTRLGNNHVCTVGFSLVFSSTDLPPAPPVFATAPITEPRTVTGRAPERDARGDRPDQLGMRLPVPGVVTGVDKGDRPLHP
jgi:hypothetical protein